MKTVLECIKPKYNWKDTLGEIRFELDESSLEIFEPGVNYIIEGYKNGVWISDYDDKKDTQRNKQQRGNRTVWKDDDENPLKIGDHATQRENRPVEKGGDGEPIKEQEIIDMFIYTWSDIMDMYMNKKLQPFEYQGRENRSFTTECRCYLKGSEKNLHADGARPFEKTLWAAWMIEENFRTHKLDITIRTIFRGGTFKHTKQQERILIATNGFIKQVTKFEGNNQRNNNKYRPRNRY